MAIFGKKKDKAEKATAGDNPSGATSPPPENARQATGSLRGGSREVTPATAASLIGLHGTNGSLSGQSGIPAPGSVGTSKPSGFVPASAGSSQLRQPSSSGGSGMSGAGSGFRFGGPGGQQSGIPQPSGIPQSGGIRSRNVSQEAYLNGPAGAGAGMAGMGAGGQGPMKGPAGNGAGSAMGPSGGLGPRGPGPMMTKGPPPQLQQQQTQQQQQQQQQHIGGPGSAGSPPQSAIPPSQSARSSGDRPRQQVVYPWSQRTLSLNPPRFLEEGRQAPPGAVSPSPFPRYGHAGNQAASPSGEVFLFGGLVRESVKNDLYILHVDQVVQPPPRGPPGPPAGSMLQAGGVTATLVQTSGEVPPPRVGHATVLVSNVLILWGGDTKIRAEDKQDEGLYLLNLGSREWTRVKAEGPAAGPAGRYGHIVAIVGSRFFVFGGQVDGNFLNDLWAFDLNSLKATPSWELMQTNGDLPPRRTGHATVTYKEKIYIFGGTDGNFHYNDTWCYDVAANSWKELSCIGYIPVPREGHAVSLVDDVMYVFGGRGVDGRDLGDLASFKISNQRWYMFENLGPAPSGRSGHILSTYQNKLVVLGGESFAGGHQDDPHIVSVLDTAKIKYPTENRGGRKTSIQGPAGQPASPPPVNGATQSIPPSTSNDVTDRSNSPTQRAVQAPSAPNGLIGRLQQADPATTAAPASAKGAAPALDQQQILASPVRVLTADQRGLRGPAQQLSNPSASGIDANQSVAPRSVSSPTANTRPFHGQSAVAQSPSYSGPRGQRSIENIRSASGEAASPTTAAREQRSINGMLERTASPMGSAPQDGFHYNSLTGAAAFGSPVTTTNGTFAPRAEYESMKKRNAWMKAALALAYKKGFVAPEELDIADDGSPSGRASSLGLHDLDTGAEGSDKDRVLRALVSLKSQLASAKATIAQQSQTESERVAEADRGRVAALQEAAFFRAKLHALEKDDVGEAAALDRERAAASEKQYSEVLRESLELERQIQSLREDVKLEQSLRQSAEERLSETAKRAMAAEGAQMRAYDELALLQKRTYGQESQLREHQERVAQLNSLVAEHQSNHEMVRSQLDEANQALQTHNTALPALQAALAAAIARAAEHERLHGQHRDAASQSQDNMERLRADLAAKTAEADSLSKRVADLETLLTTHKTEAETHRSALTGGLSQLLSLQQQRNTRSVPEAVPDHAQERIQALESETETLRELQFQSRTATDAANNMLQELRDRNLFLEKHHTGLRTELSAMRGQLAIALQEVTRLKDQSSAKEMELRDRSRALEAAQLRDNLLRRYITDRGAEVPGDDELSAQSNFADKRIRELEAEVDTRTKEARDAEHRLREAASRVEELQRDAEHRVSSRGLNASSVVPSGESPPEELERRAEEAERELAQATALYKERMAQLESDYQTAVQFVKGTEKMLRRMKDELTKYKAENASLQSELATARTGDGPMGESEAAKDIEALRTRMNDITQQAEETAAENRALEKKLAMLITDQKDFHDRSRMREDTQADSHSRRAAELESEVARLRREVHEMLQLNQHLSSELKQHGGTTSSRVLPGRSNMGSGMGSSEVTAISTRNDQLKNENEGLARRLQETEGKLSMLLGNIESSIGDDVSGNPGRDGASNGTPIPLAGAAGMPGSVLAKQGPSALDEQRRMGVSTGSTGGGGSGVGGGGGGGDAQGERYSLSSELDKWERDRSLGGSGGGEMTDPYSTRTT